MTGGANPAEKEGPDRTPLPANDPPTRPKFPHRFENKFRPFMLEKHNKSTAAAITQSAQSYKLKEHEV